MKNDNQQLDLSGKLNDEDRIRIADLFQEEIVPRLERLNARIGTLNCGFAGEKYGNWNLRFKLSGSDFIITEFEYDMNGTSVDLDL
jgi:hypothetical protein